MIAAGLKPGVYGGVSDNFTGFQPVSLVFIVDGNAGLLPKIIDRHHVIA